MATPRTRWVAAAAGLVAAAAGTMLLLETLGGGTAPAAPTIGCAVGTGPQALLLSLDQAAGAGTIAAVGRRLHLPREAVVVALATALQESRLHNLPFGDRDSLGLFQQRPSQGWGRPTQLLTPSYAASAFYRHLQAVPRWRSLPLTQAAQAVQRSADPGGYAQWEEPARALARALTGAVPRGISCTPGPGHPADAGALRRAARVELGPRGLDPAGRAHAWTAATWLVAHAAAYGVTSVEVGAARWTAAAGRWAATASATPGLRYTVGDRAGSAAR